METYNVEMEDPYNVDVKPNNEWIKRHCRYSRYLGHFHRDENLKDIMEG